MRDESGLTETEREERKTLVNSVFNGYPSIETKMLAEKLEEIEAEKRKLKVEIDGKELAGVLVSESERSELKEECGAFVFEFNQKSKSKESKLPTKLRKGW